MNTNCNSHTSSPASNPSDNSGGTISGSDFERVMSGVGGGGGRSNTNNSSMDMDHLMMDINNFKSTGSGDAVTSSSSANSLPMNTAFDSNNNFMQQMMQDQQQQQQQQQMFAMGTGGGVAPEGMMSIKNNNNNNNMGEDKKNATQNNNTSSNAYPLIHKPLTSSLRSSSTSKTGVLTDSPSPCPPTTTSSSNISQDQGDCSKRTSTSSKSSAASPRRQNEIFHGKGSFPLNLTLMLESAESMNLGHIVSWSSTGTSFIIHDPTQFLSQVLPKFFKSSPNTKIRSFYRKLNRWGFSILRGSNQPEPITAANLMQGRVSTDGRTKGVWHHPDFYRSRAVECLKMAMETGDTTCMLDVVHGTNVKGDKSGGGNNDGATKRSTKGKKRRSETLPAQDLSSIYFGQPSDNRQSHRMSEFSHRPSDFNLGDDDLNLDEFILPQVVASQQAQADMSSFGNNSQQQDGIPSLQQLMAVLNGNPFGANVSNSFTSGMTRQASMQQQPDSSSSSALMNKRGRHDGSGNFNSFTAPASSNNFNYQPVSNRTGRNNQNQGNNNRGNLLSASWTAGVATTNPLSILQHQQGDNSDFASIFNAVQEGQGENGPSPVPYMGQQQNVQQHLQSQDLQQEFQQQVQQQRQAGNQGGGGEAIDLTQEDMELSNFFENFAQTLKK